MAIRKASALMTQCSWRLKVGIIHGKQVMGGFAGDDISSAGRLDLIAEADEKLKVTKQLAKGTGCPQMPRFRPLTKPL